VNDAAIAIGVSAGKERIKRFVAENPTLSPVDVCKEACRLSLNDDVCWMTHSVDQKFTIALGLALVALQGDARERLEYELKALKMLSAAMGGVPVDFDGLGEEPPGEPLRFRDLFVDIAKEAGERI